MKLLAISLFTFMGLVTRLQLSNAQCTFSCAEGNNPCTSKNVLLYEDATGPMDVFQFSVSDLTATVTESCVNLGTDGTYCDSFDFKSSENTIELLSTAAALPDIETKFTLNAVAIARYTFGCDTSTLTVTIYVENSNDNQPEFEQTEYTASIPELSKPGYVVFDDIKLTDRDRDQNALQFSLRDNNNADIPFEVEANFDSLLTTDQVTITIKVTTSVDYERTPRYDLTLAVNDTLVGMYQYDVVTTSLVIEIEDLDDQDPSFLNGYTAIISEGFTGRLDVHPPIAAEDQDTLDVPIKFHIAGAYPCSQDSFSIGEDSGVVRVIRNDLAAGKCEIKLRAEQADNDLRFATATLGLTIHKVCTSK